MGIVYPGSPVRVSGEFYEVERQLSRGSAAFQLGHEHAFGFRRPWLTHAIFIARLTIAHGTLAANDRFQLGIDVALQGQSGGWHPLVTFPVWTLSAADALAGASNDLVRDYIAQIDSRLAADHVPGRFVSSRGGLAGTEDDGSGAAIVQMPIAGPIRAHFSGHVAGAGHVGVTAKLWIEAWSPPQGYTWGEIP